MKATDWNLAKEIRFDPSRGIVTFRNSRLVIFDATAIGLLRQNLIGSLGMASAREFFIRFGYQNGYSDFVQTRAGHEFASEDDLLASGPVLHTWEGIVKATPSEIRYDHNSGEFFFTGIWENSYEAEQHLMFNNPNGESVCWSLAGYATGWCTAFFGSPLLAVEPKCVGKGDPHCAWLIQPPDRYGSEAEPYLKALRPFWGLK